jgi:hypothetical protein
MRRKEGRKEKRKKRREEQEELEGTHFLKMELPANSAAMATGTRRVEYPVIHTRLSAVVELGMAARACYSDLRCW